jgi:phosphatidate cytidylyltransferase
MSARAKSDLGSRLGVAAVGIPVALGLIWVGGWPFALFLAVLSAVGVSESYGLARARGRRPFVWIGVPGAILLVLSAQLAGGFTLWVPWAWTIVMVAALGALIAALFWRGPEGDPLLAVGTTVLGLVYVGATLPFAVHLRAFPGEGGSGANGIFLVLFVLAVTWTGDSLAYFGGRAWGRRKLLPSVSPAKTVEGAVSGLFGSMGGAVLLSSFVLPALGGTLPLSALAAALLGLLVGIVAQLGDLVESLLKREAGVKDSGRILPGHGGVLDRFDAVLFTLPLTYALLPFFLDWTL